MELKSFVSGSWGNLRFAQPSDEPLFPVGMRANWARRRNQLYLKKEKLRALLSSNSAKKVLFSSTCHTKLNLGPSPKTVSDGMTSLCP
jgi:hypothetical protein